MRRYSDLILEGGRYLAQRCLAGKSTPGDCNYVEPYIAGRTQAERTALANGVDQKFEEGCKNGNSTLCGQGFFRKWGAMDEELFGRLSQLTQAAKSGCTGGSPAICVEAGVFIYQFADVQARPHATEFFAVACKLPPKPGEKNVRQDACAIEKKIREAGPKGGQSGGETTANVTQQPGVWLRTAIELYVR